jgi:23S rRNA (uracil1939-C5)-methyltransferase
LKRGDTLELDITDLSYLGDGVGHAENNFAVFVPGALPGERFVVEIAERRPKYARGHVRDMLVAAPDRVEAPCPYFGTCGGCQVQHLAYASQLAWKTESVRRQLQRIGHLDPGVVRPTIGMETPWNYRNQARFSLDADGHLAFTHRQSHTLLPIDLCPIMQPEIVALMPRLQGLLPGAHQLVIRYGARTGQFLIAPRLPVADDDIPSDQPWYEEVLLGRTFRVSAPSFFQVNTRPDHASLPHRVRPARGAIDSFTRVATALDSVLLDGAARLSQADVLALLVRAGAPLSGREFVVDAYCGVGTFALLLAERAGRVLGIEEARSAVLDAEHNAAGLDHVEFRQGRAEEQLAQLTERPDVVVLDPSRTGCEPGVLAALARLRPERIVYVSCDGATLARDLSRLVADGFELVEVQPIDMFPQTHHVEMVSLLQGPSVI